MARYQVHVQGWLLLLPAAVLLVTFTDYPAVMIFYLAALQGMSPSLAEAAGLEGASRWYFFRRVTFPLLMPTTLFVLVNAMINSFRLVDHIVVMTRGGPDNASRCSSITSTTSASSSGTRRTRPR